ncbi:MAG: hypothetical protein HYS17_05375 [Micavibrio aeruginosavorus]|uniref:Uncharacterized protein n=1 Tax=Micavibrio aeruginosavorus TaxID=349221 RepID=A0A7T5R447_9BACT|nr:MAG: hypothetical protein HYS17_05375 [Micavibrio aeruginosavorus]
MSRVAILGTWKTIQDDIAEDVGRYTRQVIQRGDRLYTGASPGAEHAAIAEALKWDNRAENIEVILPCPLEAYKSHILKSALNYVISKDEADRLVKLLYNLQIKNRRSLRFMKAPAVDQESLMARNLAVTDYVDEIIAFQINDSADMEICALRARKREIRVKLLQYYR